MPTVSAETTIYKNARLPDLGLVDLEVSGGMVTRVRLREDEPSTGAAELYDLDGRLVLPPLTDSHLHLDKADTAEEVDNPAGDLRGAIESWQAHYRNLDVSEITRRAENAIERSVQYGVTALRSHVDVGSEIGLTAIEGVLRARQRFRDVVNVQVVALTAAPVTGEEGLPNLHVLRAALAAGADVVGGAPHVDADPGGAVRQLVGIAAETGSSLDLHIGETLDPAANDLEALVEDLRNRDERPAAVASHCVSLGMKTADRQAVIAAGLREMDIAVVCNPQTNLYLQARDLPTAPPRGLTAVRTLLECGVTVAAGSDNIADPFNVVGTQDPFETARLLVLAAHLSPEEAMTAVSVAGRAVMGLDPAGPSVGARADFLAVRASSLREAIADGARDRLVFANGRLVASSRQVQTSNLDDATQERRSP